MLNELIVVLFNIFVFQCSSLENTVRLYDSFAEIHRNYEEPLRFRQADWDNIKLETIRLRDLSENQTNQFFERRIRRVNSNTTVGHRDLSSSFDVSPDNLTYFVCLSFEGKTVFARRYAEQKRSVPCELIYEDKETAVVRELETGYYFRLPTTLIDYTDEPQSSSIYEVSFLPTSSNVSLIVSYALSNLRWRVRYQLESSIDGETKLQMFADLINTSPLKYEFNQTELMTGDLNVVFQSEKSSSLIAPSNTADLNNVRLFSRINKSLTIDGNSILTIPIFSPFIQVRTILTFNFVLSIPTVSSNNALVGKHKFHRLFQLSNSSMFLPAGHLLLYDSSLNVLTGEWQLPTLTEFEKYEFELGQDPDVIFVYNRTISVNPNNNSSTITTNILVQNYKQRRVQIRFKSSCQISVNCVFYDDKLRTLGPKLRYNLNLDGKSEVAFTFSALKVS